MADRNDERTPASATADSRRRIGPIPRLLQGFKQWWREKRWFRRFVNAVALSAAFALGVSAAALFEGDWEPPPPIPIELPPGVFVALGDSYTAGEGLDPWEDGTQDNPTGDRCHRSERFAYARLLSFVNETTKLFRACSGAVVANAYTDIQVPDGDPNHQGLQIAEDWGVRNDVKLVTLTMGGNDVGFSKVLKRCFAKGDCPSRKYIDQTGREYPSLRHWAETRLPELKKDLVELYRALRDSFPSARILILGYPHLFPVSRPPISRDPGGICQSLFFGWDASERAAIRDWGSQLNLRISEAAKAADSAIEYVDTSAPFAGHEACGSEGAWLRAVGLADKPARDGSFHPRRVGQAVIARIVSCHLDIYESAEEAALGEESSKFEMTGCVLSQTAGLLDVTPAPTSTEATPGQ